jgi:hypothetical protein
MVEFRSFVHSEEAVGAKPPDPGRDAWHFQHKRLDKRQRMLAGKVIRELIRLARQRVRQPSNGSPATGLDETVQVPSRLPGGDGCQPTREFMAGNGKNAIYGVAAASTTTSHEGGEKSAHTGSCDA